ncbi:unnamed protein product [Ostreobium quekettii]|uniref:Ku domain-containing protein n=1 Tax=Ostreobium quekettii TaxID=121088 RepID=A0A8S1JER6_9CHLO|nr:unnamed protein product [Ostreobium quekettii]
MVQKLQQNEVKLQAVSIDFDCPFSPGKEANLCIVKDLLRQTAGEVVHAANAYEVLKMFGSKEVSPYLGYHGPLHIGDMLQIGVRVYKKVSQEKMPTLKLYSDRLKDPDAEHQVKRELEYKTLSNPDQPVPPEERVRAYKYGKQKVPLSNEEQESLAYAPEKGISLLGFADKSQAPRHEYMKDSYMVLPSADGGSCEALSALCHALEAEGRVMIVRACLRVRSALFLGVMTPVIGSPSQPDALCMNVLPFKEDVRFYAFSSFDSRPEFSPTAKQLEAAQKVVDSMDLTAGGRERLQPETTPNPILRRFVHLLGARVANPDATPIDPGADVLACHTLDPMLDDMPGCREALRDAETSFVTISSSSQSKAADEREAQAAEPSRFGRLADAPIFDPDSNVKSAVSTVGTSTPIDDFRDLLSSGRVDDAFEGMQAAVRALIASSVGARLYDKALRCLGALREAAVGRSRAREFNDFMRRLAEESKGDAKLGEAWGMVVASGISLVSNDEAAGAGVTRAEAADFLRHSAPCAGADDEDMDAKEEDEFEGME